MFGCVLTCWIIPPNVLCKVIAEHWALSAGKTDPWTSEKCNGVTLCVTRAATVTAGAAQCMCMICLGGEDAGEASTVGDSQEAQDGGDDAMGEEEDL